MTSQILPSSTLKPSYRWVGRVLPLRMLFMLVITALISHSSLAFSADAEFDFFSDQPIEESTLVIVPPSKPDWMTIGGPIALLMFFFFSCWVVKWFIPFRQTSSTFDLHNLPIAAQRGIGIAVVLYGIAFIFGGVEAHYQINLNGGAQAYFEQMGLGKIIAFTHAHLFGFTTSFFVIGIPFSLHFSRLKVYQWIFPIGLIASITDIISWWGMKYVSGNFEYITWFCGATFVFCYNWMLIGLIRVIFFPQIKWLPDFISEDEEKRWNEQNQSK